MSERDPERTGGVDLQALRERLDPHEIERLFRVVLDLSVAHQQAHVRGLEDAPLRVAYQGTEGSCSHLAAQRRYAGRAGGVLLTGHESFRGAADAVRGGEVDLALLPIENTTAGSINETYDLLAEGGLVITGELISGLEHCLLALPGTQLEELRFALSHPQALWQCERFFLDHRTIRAQAEFDTAGAARKVHERGDRSLAAIASASAAEVYGLEILARGIQSAEGNATGFVEVTLEAVPVADGAAAKSSLLVVLGDRPGALGDLLQLFSAHASIEPMPSILAAAREHAAEIRLLGTYPSAVARGT